MASAVMALKLKCGSTRVSITSISLVRLPERISLSLVMSSTTSVVTFFTRTSGAASCAGARPVKKRRLLRVSSCENRFIVLGDTRVIDAINARQGLRVDRAAGLHFARRASVVDQAAAALQVGVALEYVPVERRLLEQAARFEQVGARIGQAQHDQRVAHVDRPHLAERVEVGVERAADAVAHGARAEERQHQVRAVARAPAAEGLAEVLVVLLEAHIGRHVVQAEQPESAVEREAHPVEEAVLELALQHVVHADEQVAQVAEEVAHAVADLAVHVVAVRRRDGPADVLVERVVEGVEVPIQRLVGIARIAAGGGASGQGDERDEGEEALHFFSSGFPSAALLNRNWLIRFSSTTADCVRRRRSPCLSITPSPPASNPTYCSPSRPEVRILAVVSRGNWNAPSTLIVTIAS